jgi:hypothetical protein
VAGQGHQEEQVKDKSVIEFQANLKGEQRVYFYPLLFLSAISIWPLIQLLNLNRIGFELAEIFETKAFPGVEA